MGLLVLHVLKVIHFHHLVLVNWRIVPVFLPSVLNVQGVTVWNVKWVSIFPVGIVCRELVCCAWKHMGHTLLIVRLVIISARHMLMCRLIPPLGVKLMFVCPSTQILIISMCTCPIRPLNVWLVIVPCPFPRPSPSRLSNLSMKWHTI